jgi:hypothetical protein
MNLKTFASKSFKASLPLLAIVLMAVGAFVWSTITLMAEIRSTQRAPSIAIIILLNAETKLDEMQAKRTPESALQAASSIDQVRYALNRPDAWKIAHRSDELRSLAAGIQQIDLVEILGYPSKDCPPGEAVACWKEQSIAKGSYPSQTVANRLMSEVAQHDLRAKLQAAVKDMVVTNANAHRMGFAYEAAHPVLATVDYFALMVATKLGLKA